MRTSFKLLVAFVALGVMFAVAPPVQAQQCPVSVSYGHLFGGVLTGLPEAFLSGSASAIDSGNGTCFTSSSICIAPPSQIGNACSVDADCDTDNLNNGTAPFLCPSSASFVGSRACQAQAGSGSDGAVALNGNWGDAGGTGCPVDVSNAQLGDGPMVAYVTSSLNEGSASHAGVYVAEEGAYNQIIGGYALDLAHPTDASGLRGAVGAQTLPSPRIASFVDIGDGTADVDLEWDAATVVSDCDRGEATCVLPRSPSLRHLSVRRRVRQRADHQPHRRLGQCGCIAQRGNVVDHSERAVRPEWRQLHVLRDRPERQFEAGWRGLEPHDARQCRQRR
jgi:hypothetical protein